MVIPMYDDGQKAAAGRRERRPFHRWLMDAAGHEWCGNSGPPLDNRKIYVHDDGVIRVFSMVDDGGFVGIGYPDEWHVVIRTKAARMFAWWTFKLWVADWFGLRSWAYYTALHRSTRGRWQPFLPYGRRTRALTRRSSYDEWSQSRQPAAGYHLRRGRVCSAAPLPRGSRWVIR